MAQRATSSATLSLGLISLPVDLVSTVEAATKQATQFNLICPDCVEGPDELVVKPAQGYTCEHGHGPYTVSEIKEKTDKRGKEINGVLTAITEAEIKAASADVCDENKDKTFAVVICPAEQVENATLPAELSYRVRPPKTGGNTTPYLTTYSLFYRLASDPSKALIGEISMRGGVPKLARLVANRGMLCMQILHRPDDLAPAEHVDLVDLPEKMVGQAEALASSVSEDFHPDEFGNVVRQRLQALAAAKANDPSATLVAAPAKAKSSSVDDLEALLAASLEQANAA